MRFLPVVLLLCACGRDVTAPAVSVPPDAVRFEPSSFERAALDAARACIAAHGSTPKATLTVDQLAWFRVQGATFTAPNGVEYAGWAGNGWIVMVSQNPDLWQLTEHELAHELVAEAIPHSSPFWTACHLMVGYGTTFAIPSP